MVSHMSTGSELGFGPWLHRELQAKRMSQRQLAEHSGVDHSTISRLINGGRTPSLRTATKLAQGLRELPVEANDGANVRYLATAVAERAHPIARIEYALRTDPSLTAEQVRLLMHHYLALRNGRLGTRRSSAREHPEAELRRDGRWTADV